MYAVGTPSTRDEFSGRVVGLDSIPTTAKARNGKQCRTPGAMVGDIRDQAASESPEMRRRQRNERQLQGQSKHNASSALGNEKKLEEQRGKLNTPKAFK